MTAGVLDKLPQELRDACFDTLCDFLPEADRQQALRTCLLVCREWNHQARSHLFNTICIENRDCLRPSARSLSTVARLCDVLNDGHVSDPFPRLCSYIKSFKVKVIIAQPLWTQVDGDLAGVMKMLAASKSGLSELDVEVNGREWHQLSEGFRESLHALCHAGHLRTLKIAGVTRMPLSFFYGISLDDLWIDFRDSPTFEETMLGPPDPKGSPLLVMDFSSHTAFYPYNWDRVKDPRNLLMIKRIATSFYLADLEVVFHMLSLASRTLESLEIVRLGLTHCRDWNTMEVATQKFDLCNMPQLDTLRFALNISCFEPTDTGKFGGMISFLEVCDLPPNCRTLQIDATLHNCWWQQHQNRLFMGEDEKWFILADTLALPRFSVIAKIKVNFHVVFQFQSAMFKGNAEATRKQIGQLLQLWFSDVEGDYRFELQVEVSAIDKSR